MTDAIPVVVVAVATPEVTKTVLIAGFLGGILSMSFVDGMTAWQRAVAVTSGCIMAHYLAPLIAFLFNEVQYQETIGFLVGLFGMSICSAIFRAIKNSDIWGIVQSRFGRRGDQ